ncbi:hypothetical protein GOODEAATRI_002186, partial [Goodea atripinnis]
MRKKFICCLLKIHLSSQFIRDTHKPPTLSSSSLKYEAFRDEGERLKKMLPFKNGKMSVVPINNLGFSVRQLWGVLWIPPMGASLLPAVELPVSFEICVCVYVC